MINDQEVDQGSDADLGCAYMGPAIAAAAAQTVVTILAARIVFTALIGLSPWLLIARTLAGPVRFDPALAVRPRISHRGRLS